MTSEQTTTDLADGSDASADQLSTESTTAVADEPGNGAQAPVADEPGNGQESQTADAATDAQAVQPDEAAPAEGPTADPSNTEVLSSDPSFEAAVGSSGARALGDATSIADKVADAVGAAPSDGDEDGRATATPTAEVSADADAGADVQPAAEELDAAPPAEAPPVRVDLGPEPTTMAELLSEQTGDIKSFKPGDVVEGTVVRIDKDEILVDIGAKSEGVVSNRELYGRHAESQAQLNIGDTVLVYVLQPESNEGHVVLSLRRAGLERKWRAMQEQFESGVIIEAPVIDHNKGGLIVDCGIRGFVPISQIVDFPRRPQNDQPRDAAQEIAEKLQPFVGRKLRLKILEVNRKANRLILSEKVALYEERREKRDELFSSLKVGQRVKGTVRSIAPFGVFIDLGGIDGLVHKSELSWNKVNNPEAGYRVGEEVEAEVIDINHERGRISLSIRRLQPDPWHSTVADFNVGDVIEGTVTKIVNFGAFVRVRDGLEGLIHISELSHQRVAHPADVVHEGQRLRLRIISLDQERHRLGLSLKQAEEPPARPAEAPRERRPRQERGYDASQAVQEPEGGIDNTLAAAFAQVRQQVEESEHADVPAAAANGAGEDWDTIAARELDAVPATQEAPAAETADAPALEVRAADAAAGSTSEGEATAGTADDGADAVEAPAAPESAVVAAEPEAAEAPDVVEPPAAGEAETVETSEAPDTAQAAETSTDTALTAGADEDVVAASTGGSAGDAGDAGTAAFDDSTSGAGDETGAGTAATGRGSPDA